ncbi:MAG: 50S ribosomal protein L28 [Phycisphaerales bacterium]|nr:50S ribosomal protein L28 [Phycisphaerales bacterium]
MPRVCKMTGARTKSGNSLTRRGKAKYLGGIGIKTTSINKRTFKPNIQRVSAVIDGVEERILITARAIRTGLLVKPVRRAYTYTRAAKAAAAKG